MDESKIIESLNHPLSEGLTEERDIEVKQSLLAIQVRFLKHGKTWYLQRVGVDEEIEHILLSTKPIKSAQFIYQSSEQEEGDAVEGS